MIKLGKILHPTDFSECSTNALNYAAAFASHFDSDLHIIHIVSDPIVGVSPPISGFMPEDYYKDIIKNSDNNLAKIPENSGIDESKIVRKTLEGVPFLEIVRYAKESNSDMIVMGTHGYSGLVHLIMGSVAENVVRKAPCPVLTVHPDDHEFVMP